MNVIKKCSAFLMMLAICFSTMTMPVFAATATQDGLEVTLTTDKEEYSEGEQVLLSITVKNTNQKEVTNVALVDLVSDGYELDEEYVEAMKQIGTLAAGEEVSFSVKAVAKDNSGSTTPGSTPVQPGGNQNNNQNNNQNSTQAGGGTNNSVATVSSPKTGDNNHVAMWVVACVALVVGVGAISAVKNKKGKEILSLILCVAMVASTFVGASAPVSAAEADSADEYTLMWEDNFEEAELNRNYWNVELHEPGWVNQELQEYVDSTDNIYLEDGNLVIKAIKTGENTYTSGRVNTQGKVDYTYGKFEARIKVPSGQGLWPAFWMMPTDESFYGQWPKCGEIDIMEILGHQTTTSYGTIHFGEPHRERQGTYNLASGDFSEDFHVFAVEWEPGEIRYYVDGQLFFTANDWFTKREGFDEVAYPAPFDQPFYMILNLAVGGTMPGNPDETTVFDENTKMVVDYVKVYQKDSYDENVTRPEASLKDPNAAGNFVVNGDFAVAEDLTEAADWQFLLAEGGVGNASIINITSSGQTTSEQRSITVEKTIKYAGKDSTFKATFSYLHTEETPGTSDAKMKIESTAAGTQNHSVQLVQANIPMEQGWKYEFSFEAYADANRTIIADISAPDEGWIRYFPDTTVNLTTAPQTFTYTFDMLNETDANGRVEFNLGNQGYTDTVYIDNVVVKKVSQIEVPEEEKSILPDGNYVYNGAFDQGDNRLQYWEVVNNGGAEYSVTNVNNVREFKAVVPATVTNAGDVVLKQSDLALVGGKEYVLTFDAYADSDKAIKAQVAGEAFDVALTATKTSYKYTFNTAADASDFALEFLLGTPGTIYIDNVRIQEDGMIVNGDFTNGLVGYEPFVDTSANASFAVDELTYGGALVANIKDTGDQDWKIQLKQIVTLEKDKTYKISFDAKSTLDRAIMYAIQRDGTIHKNADGSENWTPYSDTKVINLTNEYQNFSQTFTMTADTDEKAILSISMGAVSGTQITTAHDVIIDNIVLEEVEAPEGSGGNTGDDTVTGTEILKNTAFANNGENWNLYLYDGAEATQEASVAYSDGKAIVTVTNPGTADWHIKLLQNGVTLETGATYQVKFTVNSDATRFVSYGLQGDGNWYQGGDWKYVGAGVPTEINESFTVSAAGSSQVEFGISMGKFDDATPTESTIEISNISIVKLGGGNDTDSGDEGDAGEGGNVETPVDGGILKNANFANNGENWNLYLYDGAEATQEASVAYSDGKAIVTVTNPGTADWHIKLLQNGVTLETGATYQVKFTVNSDATRFVSYGLQGDGNWYQGGDWKYVGAGTATEIDETFTVSAAGSSQVEFGISMGKFDDATPTESTIEISNISIVKLGGDSSNDSGNDGSDGDSSGDAAPTNTNVFINGDFSDGENNWGMYYNADGLGSKSVSDGNAVFVIESAGTANWHVQMKQEGLSLENGATYLLSFDITSTEARSFDHGFFTTANEWRGGSTETLEAGVKKTVNYTLSVATDDVTVFILSLGKVGDSTPASTVMIDNVSLIKQ